MTRIALSGPEHLSGQTFHGRKGAIENAFRYRVDYVLLEPEAEQRKPRLFSRNKFNLTALHDRDHGGMPGAGQGAAWVRQQCSGLAFEPKRLLLLAQPRVLGHVFNPVCFWLGLDENDLLRVVLAEVTNTYGDRHSYLVHHDDFGPIEAGNHLVARKIFHVSPFQPVNGEYGFRFDIRNDKLGIWIDYRDEARGGVLATLTGQRAPLTNRAILGACLRRPFGSRRVLGLIHWQALKLWWKGAVFRSRPLPPEQDVSS